MCELLNTIIIEELANYFFKYSEIEYTEKMKKLDENIDKELFSYVPESYITKLQDCICVAEDEYEKQGFILGFKEAMRLIEERKITHVEGK